MRVAIMQPYFLPYIGYWQLIHAVDTFVVYDNIKYTKKGWINRNRFLLNGRAEIFTLPLRKDSDSVEIRQRRLAETFDRTELINRFGAAYRKAPVFGTFMPWLDKIIQFPSDNLFEYLLHSIRQICAYLEIRTPVMVASSVDCDHSLKAAERVKAIAQSLGADTYINPIGGTELYSRENFAQQGLSLRFLQARPFEYAQASPNFVASLSIVDVAMFNHASAVKQILRQGYDIA